MWVFTHYQSCSHQRGVYICSISDATVEILYIYVYRYRYDVYRFRKNFERFFVRANSQDAVSCGWNRSSVLLKDTIREKTASLKCPFPRNVVFFFFYATRSERAGAKRCIFGGFNVWQKLLCERMGEKTQPTSVAFNKLRAAIKKKESFGFFVWQGFDFLSRFFKATSISAGFWKCLLL